MTLKPYICFVSDFSKLFFTTWDQVIYTQAYKYLGTSTKLFLSADMIELFNLHNMLIIIQQIIRT